MNNDISIKLKYKVEGIAISCNIMEEYFITLHLPILGKTQDLWLRLCTVSFKMQLPYIIFIATEDPIGIYQSLNHTVWAPNKYRVGLLCTFCGHLSSMGWIPLLMIIEHFQLCTKHLALWHLWNSSHGIFILGWIYFILGWYRAVAHDCI